jgi:hypothetical protein
MHSAIKDMNQFALDSELVPYLIQMFIGDIRYHVISFYL